LQKKGYGVLGEQNINELNSLAKEIRIEVLKGIASIGKGHVGGSLSIADVLAVLYEREMRCDPKKPLWDRRDYLVVSKGHAGPALYAVLAIKGFFPREWLYTLNKPGTKLPSHADRNKTPGVDMTTGSLGQGASTAAGLAYACKLSASDQSVYLILGDGECNEGQIWEMAIFAANKKLDNLIVFLDKNNMQADGPVDTICPMGDFAAKFSAFGFDVQEIDGHDVQMIGDAIRAAKAKQGVPKMIVLNTLKGKGIKEIEDMPNNHSIGITPGQLEAYLRELDER